jgi:nucleoside 2-deoxyribosyltransferase
MRIYLSGPMANVSDAEMHGWRDRIKNQLTNYGSAPGTAAYQFRDPTRRIYRGGLTPEIRRQIVANDKVDMIYCDMLLADIRDLYRKGVVMVGTLQEIIYAYENGKHVITITNPEDSLSPWISEHSHKIVHTEAEAISAIIAESI